MPITFIPPRTRNVLNDMDNIRQNILYFLVIELKIEKRRNFCLGDSLTYNFLVYRLNPAKG